MRRYHSPKRESEAERTRARILAAAVRHLRSPGGLESLSLESVAEAAGVTRVTLYKQFGSRRGLLEALFDDVARRGGLHRIPDAMAEKDPRVALQRIVAIFCDFWSSNRKAMGQVIAAGAGEPRLAATLRERNERRRRIIATLVRRLPEAERVAPEVCNEVVDVLFVLTSQPVFAGLQGRERNVATVCRIVQDLAMRTLDRLKQ